MKLFKVIGLGLFILAMGQGAKAEHFFNCTSNYYFDDDGNVVFSGGDEEKVATAKIEVVEEQVWGANPVRCYLLGREIPGSTVTLSEKEVVESSDGAEKKVVFTAHAVLSFLNKDETVEFGSDVACVEKETKELDLVSEPETEPKVVDFCTVVFAEEVAAGTQE